MTAQELIALLAKLPPDTIMFAWLDGSRYSIADALPVDMWDDFHADINLEDA